MEEFVGTICVLYGWFESDDEGARMQQNGPARVVKHSLKGFTFPLKSVCDYWSPLIRPNYSSFFIVRSLIWFLFFIIIPSYL